MSSVSSGGIRRTRAPLSLEVIRGPMVESVHQVVAVILDEHGSLYKSWGDPGYVVYPRSSIKPLQAIPFLTSGSFLQLGSNLEYLALACASHRGEDFHVKVLKNWAAQIDVKEEDLACGPVQGTKFRHNCSGKHLAALSVCRQKNYPIKGYYLHDHPVQQEIRKHLSRLSGLSQEKLPSGIDGCGFPTIGIPLLALASSFLPFVSEKKAEIPKAHVEEIHQALLRHSDLYSGSDDLAKMLIQKTEGKVFLKGGAEGTFVCWSPERKMTIALKVLDGAQRGAWVTLLSLLFELKLLTSVQFTSMMEHPMVAPVNSRGELIGTYKLHSAFSKD